MFGQAMMTGLKGLIDFSGRTSRGAFWIYALVLFFATQALMAISMIPIFAALGSNPEAGNMLSPMRSMLVATGAMALLFIVMIAAAIVRRLHDTGRSGWWGAMPLPFLLAGFPMMYSLFGNVVGTGGQPDMRLFGLLFANNAIYMLLLLVLAILLAMKGQPDANSYGQPPDQTA